MTLFTQEQFRRLLKNGAGDERGKDHHPIVKLFLPGSGCTWLLTEVYLEEPSLAFGLCDLGMGFHELGYVNLDELTIVKNKYGLSVERDIHFDPKYPISVYANAAYKHQRIVEGAALL